MSSILIFLSALVAASSIRPPTPSGKSTSLRAGSSNAHRTNRTSVAGSITEAEIKRVRGACKDSCPGYGGEGAFSVAETVIAMSVECCIPECISETYECQDSTCENDALKGRNKYRDPVREDSAVWFTNTTSLNMSVKVKGGHRFSDSEIQEANEYCRGPTICGRTWTVGGKDECCMANCKVDIYECHVDKSKYETCKEAVTIKHDPNQPPGPGWPAGTIKR
eukprot:gnl/TRDRNA2_/TRDRNA2_175042_c1_seq50.p1 gnl/TRDRNA2_/TRDRNA2_175042_c1~~gnl/TRDRNA2_/TRDRNA2_175042_c1_seq50.p1  ORF type:complete len:222 (-),score=11.42 gnl/TRDRNA2_/TRDRNA2_175042_c1_seq50:222-887(-)